MGATAFAYSICRRGVNVVVGATLSERRSQRQGRIHGREPFHRRLLIESPGFGRRAAMIRHILHLDAPADRADNDLKYVAWLHAGGGLLRHGTVQPHLPSLDQPLGQRPGLAEAREPKPLVQPEAGQIRVS